MRDPKWWLWLVALVVLYSIAALAGCDFHRGHA